MDCTFSLLRIQSKAESTEWEIPSLIPVLSYGDRLLCVWQVESKIISAGKFVVCRLLETAKLVWHLNLS